jgi:hypothetical protein
MHTQNRKHFKSDVRSTKSFCIHSTISEKKKGLQELDPQSKQNKVLLSPGARKQRIIHDKLRTKIRKLRKSLKLVADKKNIPRKRWQQQCGLLGGGGQQQQQRSLQSEELAHGRALSLWTHVFFLKP